MRKMLAGFNANTIIIMLVSGLLCYMQKQVLDAVWRLPAMEIQITTFQENLTLMRHELEKEREERKEADKENQSRIRMVEDREARRP